MSRKLRGFFLFFFWLKIKWYWVEGRFSQEWKRKDLENRWKKGGRKLKDKKEGSIVSNYNCIKWNRKYKRSDTRSVIGFYSVDLGGIGKMAGRNGGVPRRFWILNNTRAYEEEVVIRVLKRRSVEQSKPWDRRLEKIGLERAWIWKGGKKGVVITLC